MEVVAEPPVLKRFQWKFFAISLTIRVLGAVLIWLGDGSPLLWRKAVVVLGVVLFLVGITGLKYLLMAKPLKKLGTWLAPKQIPESHMAGRLIGSAHARPGAFHEGGGGTRQDRRLFRQQAASNVADLMF